MDNQWLQYGPVSNKFRQTYIKGFLDLSGTSIIRNGNIHLTDGDISMNGAIFNNGTDIITQITDTSNNLFDFKTRVDTSLNLVTNNLVTTDTSLNLVTNNLVTTDTSLNLVTTNLVTTDASLNTITNNLVTTDTSLNTLTGIVDLKRDISNLVFDGSMQLAGNLIPNTTGIYDIGTSAKRFRSIYVDEAHLSVNTLYIGDTPILGTNANTIEIKADANQSIDLTTTGSGNSKVQSEHDITILTSGTNADVKVQATGTNSKVRLSGTGGIEITSNIDAQADLLVGGNLTVTGNVISNGTQFTVNSTTVTTADNIIVLNSGEVGTGVTSGVAGLQVDRGSASDFQLLFDESSDKIKTGFIGGTFTNIATETYVDASVNALATRVTTTESDIGILDVSMTSIETRVTTNETDIGILDVSMNSVETRITTNETDINTLDTSMNAVETRVTTNETDIGILDVSMNSVEETLDLKANIASPTFTGDTIITGNLDVTDVDASLVHSPYVSLGTALRPTVGGNWNTIFHGTYSGNLGPNYPRPEGGILLANTAGNNTFQWNYYMGVVKDDSCTNSGCLRMDFGKATDIQSQVSGGADTSTWSPYMTIRTGKVGINTTDPDTALDVVGEVKATSFSGDGSALTGTASSSTEIAIIGAGNTSVKRYITFVDDTSGNQAMEVDGDLHYYPDSNTLHATTFAGNATTATNLTIGNKTITGNAVIGDVSTIQTSVQTLLKLQFLNTQSDNRSLNFLSPANHDGSSPFVLQTSNAMAFRIAATDVLKLNENTTVEVNGKLTVNAGAQQNSLISTATSGIGNLIKSSDTGGRNSLEGAHNYIYSNLNSGENRLYCTGTNSGNVISAEASGGYNLIQADNWNALTIGGVDKLKTTSSTTTLTSNDVVINKSGDCNLTIHSTTGSIPSLYFIRNSATYGADGQVDYRLYDTGGDFKIDSAYTGGIIRNWITLPSILGATQRMKLGDNSITYDGLDLFCGTGTAKLKLEGTTTTLTNNTTTITSGADTNDTTLNITSGGSKVSYLNVMGDTNLGGGVQGSGVVYVGESIGYGGGFGYWGDTSPIYSGFSSDYLTFFRRVNSVNTWTARNINSNSNWEFANDVKSITMNTTGDVNFADKIKTVGTTTTLNNTALVMKTNGGGFKLTGDDHVYIEFYPDNSTRRAYMGYGNSGSQNLTISNAYTSDITLNTAGANKAVFGDTLTTLTNTNNYFYATFNRFYAGDGVTDTADGQVFNQFQTNTSYGSNRLYANGINGYNRLYANGYNTIQSNRVNETANDILADGLGGRNLIRCTSTTGYTDIQVNNTSKIKVENATTTLTNTNIDINGKLTIYGNIEQTYSSTANSLYVTSIGHQTLGGGGGGGFYSVKRSVLLGYQAGYNMASGGHAEDNIFIGYQSGYNVGGGTSSNANIGIGYKTLFNSSSNYSRYNTIIGYDAGSGGQNGSNTIVGYISGRSIDGGSENALFGDQTGRNITTGSKNTLIGSNAGQSLTTGYRNTLIGKSAAYTMSTTNNNTALGYQSLGLTTGSNNTAYGCYSGRTLTTGSNNIIIGYQAEPSSATVSSEVTIGTTSTGIFRMNSSGATITGQNVVLNFTGQHHNYAINETVDEKGFIVSSTGKYRNQMTNCDECNKYKITINESLPIVEYSHQINDTKVWGVISDKDDTNTTRQKLLGNIISLYEQSEEDRPLTINSLGEGAIWVSNINGPIKNGDYITTGQLPGLGVKQDDDILHSYTVAKITTDCSFDETEIVPRKKLRYETITKTREKTIEVEKDVFDYWEDDFNDETYYENVERQIIDKVSKIIQEDIITYDVSGIPSVQVIEKTVEEEVPRVTNVESTDASGNITTTEVPTMETVSITKTRNIPKMIDVILKDASNNNLLDSQGDPIIKQYQAKKPVYKKEIINETITETYDVERAVIDPVTLQYVYDYETDNSGNQIYVEKYEMKYIIVSTDKFSVYNNGEHTELYKEFPGDFTNTHINDESIVGKTYKMAFLGCTYHCG